MGRDPAATRPAEALLPSRIDIATFSDAGNTVEPGLNIAFFQAAAAFSQWCNAAGGIDGRQIVVHDRDAALFNAAQVTSQACQQDFMSVGGGMALDAPSVPIRVGCGLGQITGFTVSDAAVSAADQVNPGGTNNTLIPAGWYSALAKKYPSAVKKYGYGAQNDASIIEPSKKWANAAVAQGWKLIDWQLPPLSVTDWTPYVLQAQSKGVEALQPSDDSAITPYVQAMNTAGYNPTFMLLTTQFYEPATTQAAAQVHFPTTYLAMQYWPFELESQSPGLQQLDGDHAQVLEQQPDFVGRRVGVQLLGVVREVGDGVRRGPHRFVRAFKGRVSDQLDGWWAHRTSGASGDVRCQSRSESLLRTDDRAAQQVRLRQVRD